MIFCPSETGDSPRLSPKAARMAVASSGVAPFPFSTSSKLSPWRNWTSFSLGEASSGAADFATFVTFSGIMRTSIEANGALGLTLPTVA